MREAVVQSMTSSIAIVRGRADRRRSLKAGDLYASWSTKRNVFRSRSQSDEKEDESGSATSGKRGGPIVWDSGLIAAGAHAKSSRRVVQCRLMRDGVSSAVLLSDVSLANVACSYRSRSLSRRIHDGDSDDKRCTGTGSISTKGLLARSGSGQAYFFEKHPTSSSRATKSVRGPAQGPV